MNNKNDHLTIKEIKSDNTYKISKYHNFNLLNLVYEHFNQSDINLLTSFGSIDSNYDTDYILNLITMYIEIAYIDETKVKTETFFFLEIVMTNKHIKEYLDKLNKADIVIKVKKSISNDCLTLEELSSISKIDILKYGLDLLSKQNSNKDDVKLKIAQLQEKFLQYVKLFKESQENNNISNIERMIFIRSKVSI